jgi:hypothetical protein
MSPLSRLLLCANHITHEFYFPRFCVVCIWRYLLVECGKCKAQNLAILPSHRYYTPVWIPELCLLPASRFLFDLLHNTEDGSNMLLRIVGWLWPNYTALRNLWEPGIQHATEVSPGCGQTLWLKQQQDEGAVHRQRWLLAVVVGHFVSVRQ